jgi:UDP-N-acetylmuramate dehydrogenase
MIIINDNINLKQHNTFGISAQCAKWIDYTSADDIPQALAMCGNGPWMHIGEGSNILFTADYNGTILHSLINNIAITQGSTVHEYLATIGSGVHLNDFIADCCDKGLWGPENLSGIPGTAGAAAVQNVGAYGIEIKDILRSVKCYDCHTNSFIELNVSQCGYGYRSSLFKAAKGRYIIVSIELRLTDIPTPRLGYAGLNDLECMGLNISPTIVRQRIIELRASKLPDPTVVGSAGSFFKNPILSVDEFSKFRQTTMKLGYESIPQYHAADGIKVPAAWLIEQCGFKGLICGNVGVWHKQPLVLVNATGAASGVEIISLERNIIDAVYRKFGIMLSPEVEHI